MHDPGPVTPPPVALAHVLDVKALHEAICRCPTCKGTCDKLKLCRSCAQIEKLIEAATKKGAEDGKQQMGLVEGVAVQPATGGCSQAT